ncbi:MAG: hypothetical protein ACI9JM_001811 [Halioglobus sp.]|jgi:hypothetical protein
MKTENHYSIGPTFLTLLLDSAATMGGSQIPVFSQDVIRGFEQSEFVFPCGKSNTPLFPPVSFTTQNCSNTDVETHNGQRLVYDVAPVSQNALLPILVGEKDALTVGEYVSLSSFENNNSSAKFFGVITVGWAV